MPNKLWTIDEVAEYLGVKRSTIYKRIQRGTIPYIKLGAHSSCLRFDPERIGKFLEDNTVEPFKR